MRGVYTAEAKSAAWNSTKSMMILQAASTKCVEIISAHVGNVGTNVTNQQLECRIARVTTYGTPSGGVGAITPTPEEIGDQAATTVATAFVTADVTTISATANLDHQGFASLAGYQFAPVPEERPTIPPSGAVVVILPIAPGVAFDAICQVKFREIG